MHRAKAKSAPPRLKSKFVKNRTNAMKEIEAWVRKDNESYAVPEASRMSGQLSDNVTEERMLKAKLWELSKERYKFLSQNSYEKKVFQDRQQKKNGLRRVASATTDGRQRRSSEDSLRSERRASLSDAVSRPRIRNARFAFLDRLDPTKNKKSAIKKTTSTPDASGDDTAKPSTRKAISRGNSSASVLNKNMDSNPLIVVSTEGKRTATSGSEQSQRTSDKTVVDRPTQLRTAHGVSSLSKRQLFPEKNPSPATTPGDAPSTCAPITGGAHVSSSSVHSNSSFVVKSTNVNTFIEPTAQQTQTTVAVTWQSRNSDDNHKYGMKIESKTNDPRYSSLESKLCPLIRSKTTGDINTIVSEIESLHVRPRRRPVDAPRSKIEVKACEFMKERGFVF